jgi:hypothetical protein
VLPRLFSIKPIHGAPGTTIRVTGSNLGTEQGDRLITLNRTPVEIPGANWSPQGFDLTLPATYGSGQDVEIGLRLADGGVAQSAAPPFHVD